MSIGELLRKAAAEAWLVDQDLDWSSPVEREALLTPEALCSIQGLDAYQKMSEQERASFRLKETAWALSNLVFGEQRGALLGAQVIVDSLEERPDDAQFLGILAAEEARHFLAIDRYLKEKIALGYAPSPSMIDLFRALQTHAMWELKIIVGQILFEPTACSMLHSLLMRSNEPLLANLIRRILRDEARHLTYSYRVAGELVKRIDARTRIEVEDLLFESIAGCVAAFFPVVPWKEHGLSLAACKAAAVERLASRGVLEFFGKVVPSQLARHGFTSERLRDLVEKSLAKRLLEERAPA